jgi:DNA-binding LacI/PurR family transcriptional regulator
MATNPTIHDVARLARSTPATVSRVLNNSGYVSAATRATVLAAIDALGYIPNANARALKTKRSRLLGVIVGDLMNPYAVALANSVHGAAASRGYTALVASAGDSPQAERAVIEALYHQRLGGLVLASVRTIESDALVARLARTKFPVLLVGRSVDAPGVDAILANYRRGGRLLTEHLIRVGHRRIGFVGARLDDAPHVERLRGHLDALEAAGLPVRREYFVGGPPHGPRYSTQLTGYQATQALLRLPSRPTALFCRNDYTALGAIQALDEAGLRIPDEMAVAGFDNIPMAAAMTPALTTVSQPIEEEGRLAAEFLIGRIEQAADQDLPRREMLLECNLIVRASTSARRTRAS